MAYHVFLSRGEDTRWTFSDHLYTALVGSGFCTLRDERGENTTSLEREVIEKCKSSIIVFSEGYVSSGQCLDELVMVLELKRRCRHVVLPVFYDLEPTQVRKQTGVVAEAFARFEGEGGEREGRDQVEVWREALIEVAGQAGLVLQNQADG